MTVIGDGTTTAGRLGQRWRRWRWVLIACAVAALAGLAALLPAPRTSAEVLAPNNPGDDGARAVAEVLADQGVSVDYVRTSADAVAAAGPGTTLLVTSDELLSAEQIAALDRTSADLVLLDAPNLADTVTGRQLSFAGAGDMVDEARRTAQCDDADADAAQAVEIAGSQVTGVRPATAATSATVCFPLGDGGYGYGTLTLDDRRVDLIGDSLLIANSRITAQGNAALALRTLGRHDHLIWYIPSVGDDGALGTDQTAGSLSVLLPPQVVYLGLLAVLVVLVLMFWRGRRLGPVVSEQLPVVVQASETTRGRARLYRRGRSYGHAGAALRAAAADRCARRLSLPPSAGPEQVIGALAQATGRTEAAIREALYGPPPTDDRGLRTLARQLDEIESEVHRP